MKKININRQYKKLLDYCEYHYDEAEDYEDDYYLFDKQKYKFIHCDDLDTENIDSSRYIRAMKFDYDYSTIDYLIRLSHNNQAVKDFFSVEKDIEQKCIDVRRFRDCNLFEGRDCQNYDDFVAFTELFVEWCEENDINYSFHCETPPKTFLSAPQSQPGFEWKVPEE